MSRWEIGSRKELVWWTYLVLFWHVGFQAVGTQVKTVSSCKKSVGACVIPILQRVCSSSSRCRWNLSVGMEGERTENPMSSLGWRGSLRLSKRDPRGIIRSDERNDRAGCRWSLQEVKGLISKGLSPREGIDLVQWQHRRMKSCEHVLQSSNT